MPPFSETNSSAMLKEYAAEINETETTIPTADRPKLDIVWRNVIIFAYLHMAAIYGLYLFFFKALWYTNLFACFLYFFSGLGITGGAHRLWAHKSYKARLPLKILLVLCNTMALQDSIIHWARDHRLHHKYSDTNADPYNSRRGFFFSHIGWLLVKKHPDIKIKGKTIDISDLKEDPVLKFQHRYYIILAPLACLVFPTYIATLWGETLWNAFFVCSIFRYVSVLNGTWLVNSAAHMWGIKPYDKNIEPVENSTVTWITWGEGYHNFHHTFPWDYKAAELGHYSPNITKSFIELMAAIGWAYDLKFVSDDIVYKRVQRTGDGSHKTRVL